MPILKKNFQNKYNALYGFEIQIGVFGRYNIPMYRERGIDGFVAFHVPGPNGYTFNSFWLHLN